jgi:putative transposase
VDDHLAPLLEIAGDWEDFLGAATDEEVHEIRRHERYGRPLGSESFVERLELKLDRLLKRGKPGPREKGN